MSAKIFSAWRFDGRSAEARPVTLRIEGGMLVVEAADGAVLERQPIAAAGISEPFGHSPRFLHLADRATIEVPEGAAFTRALAAAGIYPSLVVRLQQWWAAAVLALAAVVALLGTGYVYGLPRAAGWAAQTASPEIERRAGEQLLALLDRAHLSTSRLDEEQRAAIVAQLSDTARNGAPGIGYRLEFRSAEDAINAFALPGGIIVLLDGLVESAEDPDEVIAVLGHELGHVVHRHSMQQIFQSFGVGLLASVVWGDFSGAASHAAAALGVLRYSRDFEREADRFAVRFLERSGRGVHPLRAFVEREMDLEAQTGLDRIPTYLSTHPTTAERLEQLALEMQRGESASSPSR